MALTKISRGLLDTGVSDSSDATAITIDSSENVGIGTTSPTGKLEIAATGTNAAPHIKLTESGDSREFNIYNDGSGNGRLVLADSDDDTSDTEIVLADNGNIQFKTATSERMLIDSSGNVGIGTSSPAVLNHISAGYSAPTNGIDSNIFSLISNSASTGSYAGLGLLAGTAAASFIHFGDTDDMNVGTLDYFHSDNSMRFSTNGSERMRIASGGALMIGTTSDVGTSGARVELINVSSGGRLINTKDVGSSSCNHITFNNSNGQVGRITTSGSATAYVTSSDYRMKENLVYDWEALPKIKDLKPVQFNFKTKPDELTEGFIAHEAQTTIPYAVVGEKDGEEMQGMDYGKLTTILTKAIQEQQEQIEALQSEINTLKGE